MVDAPIAVIGVGVNNKYGHPNDTIIERLEQNETEIYRTDEMGEIMIKSNGSYIKENMAFLYKNNKFW